MCEIGSVVGRILKMGDDDNQARGLRGYLITMCKVSSLLRTDKSIHLKTTTLIAFNDSIRISHSFNKSKVMPVIHLPGLSKYLNILNSIFVGHFQEDKRNFVCRCVVIYMHIFYLLSRSVFAYNDTGLSPFVVLFILCGRRS